MIRRFGVVGTPSFGSSFDVSLFLECPWDLRWERRVKKDGGGRCQRGWLWSRAAIKCDQSINCSPRCDTACENVRHCNLLGRGLVGAPRCDCAWNRVGKWLEEGSKRRWRESRCRWKRDRTFISYHHDLHHSFSFWLDTSKTPQYLGYTRNCHNTG